MTDIQRARDVLAKWRGAEYFSRQKWFTVFEDPEGWVEIATQDGSLIASGEDGEGAVSKGVARLIVGTAGNPDLLDAIDGLLATAADFRAHLVPGFSPGPLIQHAERIAAAIIAADERMQQ